MFQKLTHATIHWFFSSCGVWAPSAMMKPDPIINWQLIRAPVYLSKHFRCTYVWARLLAISNIFKLSKETFQQIQFFSAFAAFHDLGTCTVKTEFIFTEQFQRISFPFVLILLIKFIIFI
jgi:hypothetical protein